MMLVNKNTLVILSIVFIQSCAFKTNDTNSIQGNWSVVDTDSSYYEVEIRNDSILTYSESLSFLPIKSFWIEKDSMFIKHNLKQVGYLLQKENKHTFYLETDAHNTKILFKRILDTALTFNTLKDYKETKRFKVHFFNRKNKLLGIPKRFSYKDTIIRQTDEEIGILQIK